MNRWTVLLMTMMLTAFVVIGCSGGGESPMMPGTNPDITGSTNHMGQTQTHLWGYYDVYIDIENQTVVAVLNRQAMFAVNKENNEKGTHFYFRICGAVHFKPIRL